MNITVVMMAALSGLSLYLGMRLHSASIENSALRVNLASLKRRLAKH